MIELSSGNSLKFPESSFCSQAIGVFDSGVGGLTVMQEMMKILPHERFIYFADTARIPYGNKSSQTIIRYANEIAHFLIEKGVKALVVACNTASALALSELRKGFPLPILGVIEPAVNQAIATTKNGRIGVLGTRATIQSCAYQSAIRALLPDAQVFSIACPLLVPIVEESWMTHPAAHLIVKEYLCPLREEGIDTLILGCTHYPFLHTLIQREVGEEVTIVESPMACAKELRTLLGAQNLFSLVLDEQHEYYTSDDADTFRALAEKLFGQALGLFRNSILG